MALPPGRKPLSNDWYLKTPKHDWKCELTANTVFYCEEGKQPNAFHRFMQQICFGFKWTKHNE